jgi:hypothetical protein
MTTRRRNVIAIYIAKVRITLNCFLGARWGKRVALGVEPLEIEQWLQAAKKEEGQENPTVDKMRRVMSLATKAECGTG